MEDPERHERSKHKHFFTLHFQDTHKKAKARDTERENERESERDRSLLKITTIVRIEEERCV